MSQTPAPSGRSFWPRQIACALGVAGIILSVATARAATLNWDPNISGAPSDGSGNWTGSNTWWDGTADVAWVASSTAIIGANTPGTYSLVLPSAVTATSVQIVTSGYTLSGATLTSPLTLGNGVVATVSNLVSLASITVGANSSSLTLAGGVTLTGNPLWLGSSVASSTLNIVSGPGTAGPGTLQIYNLTVNQSNGVVNQGSIDIGYHGPCTYNLSGGQLNATGTANSLVLSRGYPAILNVSGNALLSGKGVLDFAGIEAADNATLNVSGGTVIIGPGATGTPGVTASTLQNISIFQAATTWASNSTAIINISGGTVAAKGISFGFSAGNYTANPICQLNVTGGLIYLDSFGIAVASGSINFTSAVVNLGGGTIAATAAWADTRPSVLTGTNGNLTLQAADVNGSPFNITMSGGLSGPGGINKTGGGILTLSGANSYTGTMSVSNGQLTVSTAGGTSIGSVSFNSGTTLSTTLGGAGQSWTNKALDVASGSTLDFNFAGFQLSRSVSVIKVNGDLTLDSSDNCTIEGAALLDGTFPLMTCTGTLTLTGGSSLPTITSLPAGVMATLVQSGNTINLQVTGSPNTGILNWGPSAAGPWDFSTADWINAGNQSAVAYTDGSAVNFNDNAQSAVVITLNTTVNPNSVMANNTAAGTASYTITGNGGISGNTSVQVEGSGALALATTNTYTGGTTVNAGTLDINYGGDGTGPSAIGEGPLTLNTGATIDNTSGANLLLNVSNPEYWNGNFTYAGSQTNLDLGTGPVVLGSPSVQVTVSSNMLTYDGSITDQGLNYALVKAGLGALTLTGQSTYRGGTILNAGTLNINNGGDGGADSAIGAGTFTINGGTIDNTSGSPVQFQTSIPNLWNASFAFAGTGNLDLGLGTITSFALTLTLGNGTTLRTEGPMIAQGGGGNATLTLTGNGTFQTSGGFNNLGSTASGLSITVNSGALLLLDKAGNSSVHSTLNLTLNPGGTARVTGTGGYQIGTSTAGLVTLGGGTLDLFGSPNENIYSMTFNSGTLQNSSTNNPAILTMSTSINLTGAACNVDVATNSSLSIPGGISGAGSLVKLDWGTLNLGGTNTYSGSTTVSNGLLTFTTATTASGNYTVAGGELEAMLDPLDVTLQMAMSNLTFSADVNVGFDLASGNSGDTTASLISAKALIMNGNVAVDVFNAPRDNNDDVLLTYTSRQGPGLFVAGNIPAGAYIYDNTAAGTVTLTYTAPPPPTPSFSAISGTLNGGELSSVTFSGFHGPAGGSYEVMSSTNVSLSPFSAWTPVQSGTFDTSGSFSSTISVTPGTAQNFYLLRVP